MTKIRRVSAVVAATCLLALAPALAKTIDFDAATIADINAAFDAGTLTAESLTQMCLARIAAFDRKGPSLHAVITLNPKAIEQARPIDHSEVGVTLWRTDACILSWLEEL